MPERLDPLKAIGAAGVELRFAAAELRIAATREDAGDRGLLYTLADRLEQAAERLAQDTADRETGLESKTGF